MQKKYGILKKKFKREEWKKRQKSRKRRMRRRTRRGVAKYRKMRVVSG